jgi:hypothetical protein
MYKGNAFNCGCYCYYIIKKKGKMWVRQWTEKKEGASRKLLKELKSEDEICAKKFFFIPLPLYSKNLSHFVLVSIERFKFLL